MKAQKAGLARHLTDRSMVFDDPSTRQIYSFDQGEVPELLRRLLLPDSEPDLVVQPATVQDLAGSVRYANERNVALTPRGAATFGMGGAVPHHGGILLDFSTRREIYEFDKTSHTIKVGAGCRWADVSQFLKPHGFDLCTYPTSWFSTVGGWASTGGCGIGCTRYGCFHDLISAITVVSASGDVSTLRKGDPNLRFFLGTEGQMGAIWDVTFAVRPKPLRQVPLLILCDTNEAALECAAELLQKFRPYHLKFLDAARMHEINHLMREEHPLLKTGAEFAEKPTLLVSFEEGMEEFRKWARKKALLILSDFKAHLLWRERMFPLRVKRLAPGLLASELILPLNRVAAFVNRATNLGKTFGVTMATECYFLNDGTALTLPVYTFHAKTGIDQALKSSLAYVLTQTGIRMGGRPYGIGIWNTPFAQYKFETSFHEVKRYKKRVDSQFLFNRGKFFTLNFRTGGLGKLIAVPLQPGLIPYWTALQPLLARVVARRRVSKEVSSDLLLRNEELCSKCGSCISVCPAYIDTQDERTTARGKLRLAKTLSNGNRLTSEEANILFLCMHCGACTDVCQSRLDLVPVWDELERRVEQQFGRNAERIEQFVSSVEAKKIMGVPYARGAEILTGHKSE